jgi:membrane-anchored glycerophosphoryl diester phosphodiesterase (GDPDase)
MLVCMMASVFLVSVASMVFWIANCIVVSDQERVMAAWRQSLRFCRRNFSAVLVMWLLSLAVGILISPLSLVGPLGVVKEVWVLAALALLYSAIIGYVGVLWTGVGMSLYLARRPVLVEFA